MDREEKRAARVELIGDILDSLLMGEYVSLRKIRKRLRDAGLGNPTENQLWDGVRAARVTVTPGYRAADVRKIEEAYKDFDEAYMMMQGSIDLAHGGKLEGLMRVSDRNEFPFIGV